ncbi:hypothetical protein Tco_1097822, partial [Tanacetum coccineum]
VNEKEPQVKAIAVGVDYDISSSEETKEIPMVLEMKERVEKDQLLTSLETPHFGDITIASIRKLIDEFTLSDVSSSTRWIKAVPIKEDELAKLSSSIFVTNFPDKFSAKELWTSDDELSNEGSFDENGGLRITPNVEGESDLEEVAEIIFEKEQDFIEVKEGCNSVQKKTRSEDPFNIYDLLDKKMSAYCDIPNSDDTLKYPPGFTPETDVDAQKKCFKSVGYGRR